MKIKSIRIANFKSFRDCTIELNDFNIIIGANASGKSNFVQIFRFIKDIQKHGLENAISLQGGIEYLRNNNIGASQDFLLEIIFLPEPSTRGVQDRIGIQTSEVIYKFAIEFYKRKIGIKSIKEDNLTLKVNLVRIVQKKGLENQYEKVEEGEMILTNSSKGLVFKNSFSQQDLIDVGNIIPLIFLKEKLKSNSLLLETPFLRWLLSPIIIEQLGSIGIFDFDPKLPKKATPITGKVELDEDGGNLAIVLKKILEDNENKRKLANIIKDLLPFISELDVEKFADKSLMFTLKEIYSKKAHYLPASFISDGTINIIALVIALYFDKAALAIIEEPERNIHPHLISRVVEMMKEASHNKQIIVTTHNPEIVKYADLKDIILISRQDDGFSCVSRPADLETVKAFLENEIGIEELYVQNLLGIGG
jgi:predicted ATPase